MNAWMWCLGLRQEPQTAGRWTSLPVSPKSTGGPPHFSRVRVVRDVSDRLAAVVAGVLVIGGACLASAGIPIERWRVDPTFDAGEIVGRDTKFWSYTTIEAFALAPDGRIYIGGHLAAVQGIPRNAVARLLPDGRLDSTFDPGQTIEFCTHEVFLQGDGRLVAGWSKSHRFHSDGSRDPSFDSTLEVIALLPGGDILALDNGATPVRLRSDGTRDPGFASPAQGTWSTPVLVLPEGGALMATSQSVARLLPDGRSDPSFQAPQLSELTGVSSLLSQGADGYLIGGSFASVNGMPRRHLARLHTDGSVDAAFDSGDAFSPAGPVIMGRLRVNPLLALASLPDGRILAGGCFTNAQSSSGRSLARLHPDGRLDRTFQFGDGPTAPAWENHDPGFVDVPYINNIVIQSDGRLLLSGNFTTFSEFRRMGIVRLMREEIELSLTAHRPQADGAFMLEVIGTPGLTGTVQATASLEGPDWRKVDTYVLPDGRSWIRDPAAMSQQRFYRATVE